MFAARVCSAKAPGAGRLDQVVDWTTIAALATAGGTLVLAIATIAAVRSANRSARLTEDSMKIGIRPLLMPSRLEDVSQKIMWGDEHWALLKGSEAHIEIAGDNVTWRCRSATRARGSA